MKNSPAAASFLAKGIPLREYFPHEILCVPKLYPDTLLKLAQRGVPVAQLLDGAYCQVNLYATNTAGLPDELFWDRQVNWHQQQFGRRGHVGAAGLYIVDGEAFVACLQSDLCQQIYRSDSLRACRTQVRTRYGRWYKFLVNGILDFARDEGLRAVYVPTSRLIVDHTAQQIHPELFARIYDYPAEFYRCDAAVVGGAEYWRISIRANGDRIVRLLEAPAAPDVRPRKLVCLFHDTEENVDTDVSPSQCRAHLARMLQLEATHGIHATYNVVGTLYKRKAPLIRRHGHCLGLHTFNHRIGEPRQLERARGIDLQIRGYRPARSILDVELNDFNLVRHNFEWLMSSERSLGFRKPRVTNGLLKIPVRLDDYGLHTGAMRYREWRDRLLAMIEAEDFIAVGLHDCYAGRWIDHYDELLTHIRARASLWTADELADFFYRTEGA